MPGTSKNCYATRLLPWAVLAPSPNSLLCFGRCAPSALHSDRLREAGGSPRRFFEVPPCGHPCPQPFGQGAATRLWSSALGPSMAQARLSPGEAFNSRYINRLRDCGASTKNEVEHPCFAGHIERFLEMPLCRRFVIVVALGAPMTVRMTAEGLPVVRQRRQFVLNTAINAIGREEPFGIRLARAQAGQ